MVGPMSNLLAKMALKWTGVLLVVAVGVLAALLINAVWFRPWSIRVFFEREFLRYAWLDPELLTSLGLLESFGLRSHNARLTDASPAHTRRQLALARESLRTLEQYPWHRLHPQDRLSARVFDWYLRTRLEGERFAFHDYPVNQFEGVQSALPEFLITMHRIRDRRDAEHYLQRLASIPTKWEQLLASLRLREQRGIVPPRFVVQRVRTEIGQFIAPPAAQNPLARVFAENVSRLGALSAAQKIELTNRAVRLVETAVYPAYQRLLEYLTALEDKTTEDDGVWKLPEGDAFYAWILRMHTTTSLTPTEIHQLGLREVARIESEMRAILDTLGHTGETPAVWLQRLAADPRFLWPNTDTGRQQALAEYRRIVEEMLAAAPHYFSTLPRARLEVRPVPDFKAATAPAAYYNQPSMDGSRPGIFFINLRDLAELPRFGMKTLTYHEAVPGHHFQIALALEQRGMPTFRKLGLFTAYAEGWALYAERLAKEAGFYADDPYGDLGRLQDEMLRAVRLVVDTGLHAQRWTRAQAIDYMIRKTGMPEPAVVTEVERYIVAPGQACAYTVGLLKLLELRERARMALGADFNLRAFHDVVLRDGALPLELLEQRVNDWIARERAAPAAG